MDRDAESSRFGQLSAPELPVPRWSTITRSRSWLMRVNALKIGRNAWVAAWPGPPASKKTGSGCAERFLAGIRTIARLILRLLPDERSSKTGKTMHSACVLLPSWHGCRVKFGAGETVGEGLRLAACTWQPDKMKRVAMIKVCKERWFVCRVIRRDMQVILRFVDCGFTHPSRNAFPL